MRNRNKVTILMLVFILVLSSFVSLGYAKTTTDDTKSILISKEKELRSSEKEDITNEKITDESDEIKDDSIKKTEEKKTENSENDNTAISTNNEVKEDIIISSEIDKKNEDEKADQIENTINENIKNNNGNIIRKNDLIENLPNLLPHIRALRIDAPESVEENEDFYIVVKSNNHTIQNAIVRVGWSNETYYTNQQGRVNLTAPSVDNNTTYGIKAKKRFFRSAKVPIIVTPQNPQTVPSIIFNQNDSERTLTVVNYEPEHILWHDIEINGSCNTSGLGINVNSGDQISNCYGIIRIIYEPTHVLIAVFNFSLSDNYPPNTPEPPFGNETGTINTTQIFVTQTNDPEGELVFYLWDWGDGNYSEWLGPYASGIIAGAMYSWSQPGTYQIRVKAKDINDLESGWSNPFNVLIS